MKSKIWFNQSIRVKVFTLSFVIAIIPILVVNTLWSMSAHDQLEQASIDTQLASLDNNGRRIDRYLDTRVKRFIASAQEFDIANLQTEQAARDVLQYAKQDTEIKRIALVDSEGNEQIVVEGDKLQQQLKNIATNGAFQAIARRGESSFMSSVQFDGNEPKLVIAVPITPDENSDTIKADRAALSQASQQASSPGVFMVDLSLATLWDSILGTPLGSTGYSYIVDAQGTLIGHPDKDYFEPHKNMSHVDQVARFLSNQQAGATPETTVSEHGTMVMSSHQPVYRTGWAIIAEEPEESIYAPVQHVYRVIMWIFISASLMVIFLGLYFSSTLTRPLKALVTGTSELGQGKLDTRIPILSNDEIGLLAERFNGMADNLKRLVSNLKSETTKLNVVLDSVGEGILAVDRENRIVVANVSATKLAGAGQSSLAGKRFDEVFHLTKNNQPFSISLGGTEVYKDVVYMSPNKRLHYLDIFVYKIEDDPDGITNIITLRDLTDERDLEIMKHDFVSMAAHELRTPITAIRGYLDLMAVDKASDLSDNTKHSIERARSSTEELVGLINNLLNVSKIEGGTLDMAFGKVNWVALVKSALDNHRFGAAEKDITLEYDGPEHKVFIIADEIAIKEVANNLIANAIHYTNEDGHITVSVRTEKDQVITSVKDTGIGIPPNAIKRLFTKFFRVKGGMASGSGGTGLGLFISKSIVELHKGRIWVESEEGKGTTFTFTLPAFDEVQYEAIANKQAEGVKKRRGWVTKNTAR